MIINLAKIRFGGTGNTGGGTPAKPEDSFQETYTANGAYDITPETGHVFSGGHVEVDVHPTETLSLTITESGSYTSNDEFNGYSINVNVEGPKPEETLTQTITENGSHVFNPSEGHVFNSASITVDVPQGITPTGTININDNGTYDVTDKATAVVAVGGKDYRYKTGTLDVAGLTAIGWNADDIGYYGANVPHYAWENDNYKVSQENIDLYSLDDPDPDLYKDNPNVTFVPNKNMSVFDNYTGDYKGMKYIKGIPLYDTSSMSSMYRKFWNFSSLETIPLFDTSNVTNMGQMFQDCNSLQSVPPFDTSKVTSMSNMFGYCSSLTSIPQLNTSNVTDMSSMFEKCSSLQTIPQLDTSSVTNMNYMFRGCSKLTSVSFTDTSKVTGMNQIFIDCTSLQSISSLDTRNITIMDSMFSGCSSLQTIPQLDTSNVTRMNYMFSYCSSLTSIPQLNTSNVTDMGQMFYSCSKLTSVSFTDTSKVTSMNQIFNDCKSLQRVEGIDFSSLTSKPDYFFGWNTIRSLTRFIVSGSINFSWNDSYGLSQAPNLNYESIKSILEAMNRTDNTNAKEMKFNCVIVDQNGELAGLVSSCATKGWTVTGLTLKEQSVINSITPNKEHITRSDFGSGQDLVFTINANRAWSGACIPKSHSTTASLGVEFDYYDILTNKKVRSGNSTTSNYWTVASGDAGETQTSPEFWKDSYYMPSPQSGEYALVGISFRDNDTPYEYVDYYFKVYPDGE